MWFGHTAMNYFHDWSIFNQVRVPARLFVQLWKSIWIRSLWHGRWIHLLCITFYLNVASTVNIFKLIFPVTHLYNVQFRMDCGQLRVSLSNVAVFPAIQYLWQRLACWNNRWWWRLAGCHTGGQKATILKVLQKWSSDSGVSLRTHMLVSCCWM